MPAAPPTGGARNMALDHALAELNEAGRGVVRFYRWTPHTISFGRNEPARGRWDQAAAGAEGLAFVRRPTGGRAVLHAHEVTYCVVVPVGALGGLRDTYVRINEGLVAGLRALGCPAEVVRQGSTLPLEAGPCFQAPAPGEVTLHGRKLVGSAQVRLGPNLLQHGSVILSGDQSALGRLSAGGGRRGAGDAAERGGGGGVGRRGRRARRGAGPCVGGGVAAGWSHSPRTCTGPGAGSGTVRHGRVDVAPMKECT